MTFSDKIPFLAKYHKKKLIASILAAIIIYTYDLQKRNNLVNYSNNAKDSFDAKSYKSC
jgi:hypothetical protein